MFSGAQGSPPQILTSNKFNQVVNGQHHTEAHERAYKKFVDLLMNSELTRGANIKRLSGELFRFKMGQAARILAVRKDIGGQTFWVLTDLLLNHEYKNKIEHFNFDRVDRVLDDFFGATAMGGGGGEKSAQEKPSAGKKGAKFSGPVDVSIYKHQMIARTKEQETSVSHHTL